MYEVQSQGLTLSGHQAKVLNLVKQMTGLHRAAGHQTGRVQPKKKTSS